jgi:hypothetical protein
MHPAQDLINIFNSLIITYRIPPTVIPPGDLFRHQSLKSRQTLYDLYHQFQTIMMRRGITAPPAYTTMNHKYVEVLRTLERHYNTPPAIDPFKYPINF